MSLFISTLTILFNNVIDMNVKKVVLGQKTVIFFIILQLKLKDFIFKPAQKGFIFN